MLNTRTQATLSADGVEARVMTAWDKRGARGPLKPPKALLLMLGEGGPKLLVLKNTRNSLEII